MRNSSETEEFTTLETEFKVTLERLRNAKDLDDKLHTLNSLNEIIRRVDALIERSQQQLRQSLNKLDGWRE